MAKKSPELAHIIELLQLSNEYSENLEPYEQVVKLFKMEHLAQLHSPEQMIPMIIERYAYIMKTNGKQIPLMVQIIEQGIVVDAQPKVLLCNLCYKPATTSFKKFNMCSDHGSDLKEMCSYFNSGE